MTDAPPIGSPGQVASAHYCQTCEHPKGYHHAERGCTMPLDRNGLPVMRTDETVKACGCQQEATR